MPRLSKRNLLKPLEAANIDVRPGGPKVSDDIQLVYQLDDIGEQLFAYGAIGDFTSPPGARIHILQGEVRNRRGMFIREWIGTDRPGHTVNIFTNDTGFEAVMGNIVVEPIGINEGGCPTKTIWLSGDAPVSVFTNSKGSFRLPIGENYSGSKLEGMFVGPGRFIIGVNGNPGLDGEWSVMWREFCD